MPFTVTQFLDVFRDYNLHVFPMQIVLFFLGLIAIYLAVKPSNLSDKIISGILSFFWLWMGVVYHFMFFTSINKAAWLFGALCILQGLLFLIVGVIKNKLSFLFGKDAYGMTGMMIILFAMIAYPVLGYFLGHIYPYSPTFGLPCPTTIFTFGFLILMVKKIPVIILVIPYLWSIIGFMAAIKFGIIEDSGLILTGILTMLIILYRNRFVRGKVTSM